MSNKIIVYYGAILFMVSLIVGMQLLDDSYLRGPDAYYYALQADHWATTGNVKIPDSSYIHRVHGLMQRFGLGSENAIRIWSIILLFGLGLTTLLIMRSRFNLSIVAIVIIWMTLSPSLLFVVIEFPKLFTLLLILPVILKIISWSEPRNMFALIPIGLSVFIHRAAIPISGLLALILFFKSYSGWYHRYRKLLVTVLIVMIGTIIAYFSLGDRFHLLDLLRLGNFRNVLPGFVSLLKREGLPILIKVELIISLLIFIIIAVIYYRSFKSRRLVLLYPLALILPGFFPFSTTEVFGIGERYAILLPYLFLLSSVYLLALFPKPTISVGNKVAAVMVLISFIPLFWRLEYSHPNYLDPDNEKYEKITSLLKGGKIPMLIVHRGFNFYYKFVSKQEAFHYEPESHWEKKNIWRLSYRITVDEFEYYLPSDCKWESGKIRSVSNHDYFLIREDCWSLFRDAVKKDDNQDLFARIWGWWRNPSQSRPAFLYRKHQNDPKSDKDPFAAMPQLKK